MGGGGGTGDDQKACACETRYTKKCRDEMRGDSSYYYIKRLRVLDPNAVRPAYFLCHTSLGASCNMTNQAVCMVSQVK